MEFSPLVNVAPSASVAMNTLALEKKAKGQRVYNLAAGEPMVDTDIRVIDAAKHAMEKGKTHYPPVAGIPELREAASNWVNTTYGASYTANNTIVTCGGKFGIFALCQALLRPGDEVLIPAPYWVSYPSMVQLFGGTPVAVNTEQKEEWKISLERLEKAWTPKTRLLMFNNASNPTGVLYDKQEIEQILAWAQDKNIIVISDEVYSGLVYDGNNFVSCASFPEYQDRIIVIQSCSKHFAMTGWRVGFVLGPSDVTKKLTMLQGQSTTGTSSISQWAALAAVQNAREIIPMVRDAIQHRRDRCAEALNNEFGAFTKPLSSLYFFLPLSYFGITETRSDAVALDLLERGNIATVPGAAFGKEGYLRFSFGDTAEELTAAITALAQCIK